MEADRRYRRFIYEYMGPTNNTQSIDLNNTDYTDANTWALLPSLIPGLSVTDSNTTAVGSSWCSTTTARRPAPTC